MNYSTDKSNSKLISTRIKLIFTKQKSPSKKLCTILTKIKNELPLEYQDVKYINKAYYRQVAKN